MNNTVYNIIFCGTPACAVPSLQALLKHPSYNVVAVVTQPDRPVGRKQELTCSPVKTAALAANIPVLQPEKLVSKHLAEYTCDYLVVVAYGQIISKATLAIPTIAAINVHPSLLPRWRGATPIPATIASGDTIGGVTIQKMQYELDAGDIVNVYTTPIANTTTSEQLFNSLFIKGAELLVETLNKPLKLTKQDDSKATYCGKLSRADGQLDPELCTAEHIERLHRAYYPWPGITLQLPSGPLKLHTVSLSPTPGSALLICKDNTQLYLQEVQAPNKQKTSGETWQSNQ